MAKKRSPKLPRDVAVLHGPTEDGKGARMLRFKEGAVYAGEVRPVREGEPLTHHEIVRLRPLSPDLPICEVETLHAPAPSLPDARASEGPARVSNATYRRNWNAVFGTPNKKRSDYSVN